MVFVIGRLIDTMVPDIPVEVELKMKREHYMAKEALAENQVGGEQRTEGWPFKPGRKFAPLGVLFPTRRLPCAGSGEDDDSHADDGLVGRTSAAQISPAAAAAAGHRAEDLQRSG